MTEKTLPSKDADEVAIGLEESLQYVEDEDIAYDVTESTTNDARDFQRMGKKQQFIVTIRRCISSLCSD